MSLSPADPPSSRPVVLVPGDGIGPEVVESAREVLAAAHAPITWDIHQLPDPRALDAGLDGVDGTLDAIRHCRVALR